MNRRCVSRAKVASRQSTASAASVATLMPRFRIVSIIPGIDTGAPERTDTSSGRGPAPNCRSVIVSSQRMPAAISSSRPSGKWPRSRKAAQARVVITKLGGTFRPSALIRAIDQALPPIRSRCGNREPSSAITQRPSGMVIGMLLLGSLAAEDAQQVLVQLEPDRVVAQDSRVADPLDCPALCALQRREKVAAIVFKARQLAGQLPQGAIGSLVQLSEAVNDAHVVVTIRVSVRHACAANGHHLPIRDQPLQLHIDALERLVCREESAARAQRCVLPRILAGKCNARQR